MSTDAGSANRSGLQHWPWWFKAALAFLVIGTVIAMAVAIGYRVGINRRQLAIVPTPPSQPTVVPVAALLPAGSPVSSSTKLYEAYIELPSELAKRIKWEDRPVEINKLGWLGTGQNQGGLDGEEYGDPFSYEAEGRYFRVGTFDVAGQQGRIILVESPPGGPGPNTYYRVVEWGDRVVILKDYSTYRGATEVLQQQLKDYLYDWNPSVLVRVGVADRFSIPELDFPKEITGPGPRQILRLEDTGPMGPVGFFIPSPHNEERVFVHASWGDVTTATNTGAFYIRSVHGTTATYTLVPDFFSTEKYLPYITWNDGNKNTTEYSYTDSGGCGRSNYLSVVTGETVDRARDLRQVGKTTYGDIIYEFKDPEHRLLKEFYESSYFVGPDEKKVPYQQFVARRPVLFWVDPFDRLVKLESRQFVPPAECAKPVIYLYPQEPTRVTVQVEPKGGLTKVDPPYHGGWLVTATPNGQLTDLRTGLTYPYLFWEGQGGMYRQPSAGFIVKRDDLSVWLPTMLGQLGLNATEAADFMEFWLPLMQEKPYYFVTFLGNSAMNELAPLMIEPKPDTLIRVLMDFTPLDRPVAAPELRLPPVPSRQGFTVVEWGGVAR